MDPPSPRKSYATLQVPDRPTAMKPTSSAPRNVTQYLEQKIVELTSVRKSLLKERDNIINEKELMDSEIFQDQLKEILDKLTPNAANLRALSQSKRVIEQDMEEELEGQRATKKLREQGPELEFFERAYANSLVPRVMGFSGKQTKLWNRHDQRKFREDVLESYNAINGGLAWCCIWGGWFSKVEITAAHLVPKALSEDEVSFLFGANQRISGDPKNGVSLHTAIETALNTGRLVIAPIMPLGCNRWRTVLVDQTKGHLKAFQIAGSNPQQVLWRVCASLSICNNSQEALTDLPEGPSQPRVGIPVFFRPARRFLYFRFVMTYLHAKEAGNKPFTDSVGSKTTFWASGGPYLHQSTLKSLARCISGLELPPTITASTFEDPAISESDAEMAGEMAPARVREAAVESLKTEARNDNRQYTNQRSIA